MFTYIHVPSTTKWHKTKVYRTHNLQNYIGTLFIYLTEIETWKGKYLEEFSHRMLKITIPA